MARPAQPQAWSVQGKNLEMMHTHKHTSNALERVSHLRSPAIIGKICSRLCGEGEPSGRYKK